MYHNRIPYDAIPYIGAIAPNTSPAHMAICLLWHQRSHDQSQQHHFTELGCGDATNLLPLAFYNPASTFTGIDSSQAELGRARLGAECLGLENIQFILKDVRDLGPADLAPSDYVIAHGLYSWVPADAREAILAYCGDSLKPNGLAYISYNAQPGWAIRGLVREALMRDRTVREAPVEEKARRAIALAGRLIEDLPSQDYAHAVLLAEELERVRDGKPFYVFHEYLAEVNEGFWLRDFVEDARRHALDYVCGAQFCRWEGHVPSELRAALAQRDLDYVEQEEAADLLGDRYFRASILCRGDARRSDTTHQEILEEVYIATSLGAVSDPFDLREGVVEQFEGQGIAGKEPPTITIDASITKAAVVLLSAQWPFGLLLDALCAKATEMLTTNGCEVLACVRLQLGNDLCTLFEAGQVDFRLWEPAHQAEILEYPQAHALARFEAEHREALTTPYHLPIPFEPGAMAFVRDLDGSRSREELRQAFGAELVDQTLPILSRWGLLENATPGIKGSAWKH